MVRLPYPKIHHLHLPRLLSLMKAARNSSNLCLVMRGPINDFAHVLIAAKSWRWVGGSNMACILKYKAHHNIPYGNITGQGGNPPLLVGNNYLDGQSSQRHTYLYTSSNILADMEGNSNVLRKLWCSLVSLATSSLFNLINDIDVCLSYSL